MVRYKVLLLHSLSMQLSKTGKQLYDSRPAQATGVIYTLGLGNERKGEGRGVERLDQIDLPKC